MNTFKLQLWIALQWKTIFKCSGNNKYGNHLVIKFPSFNWMINFSTVSCCIQRQLSMDIKLGCRSQSEEYVKHVGKILNTQRSVKPRAQTTTHPLHSALHKINLIYLLNQILKSKQHYHHRPYWHKYSQALWKKIYWYSVKAQNLHKHNKNCRKWLIIFTRK